MRISRLIWDRRRDFVVCAQCERPGNLGARLMAVPRGGKNMPSTWAGPSLTLRPQLDPAGSRLQAPTDPMSTWHVRSGPVSKSHVMLPSVRAPPSRRSPVPTSIITCTCNHFRCVTSIRRPASRHAVTRQSHSIVHFIQLFKFQQSSPPNSQIPWICNQQGLTPQKLPVEIFLRQTSTGRTMAPQRPRSWPCFWSSSI